MIATLLRHVWPRIVLDPSGGAVLDALVAGGLLGRLVFATDDCDATFEHLEAAGADVIQEPIDQPGGVRDCAFRDPSGTIVRFTQAR
jgi:predicted enzyme related to lactoylglutathione lyase